MPARVQTRPRPAEGGAQIQLRWWAVALPAGAFAALLLLILNPADAHAAGTDLALTHILQSLQHLVPGRTS